MKLEQIIAYLQKKCSPDEKSYIEIKTKRLIIRSMSAKSFLSYKLKKYIADDSSFYDRERQELPRKLDEAKNEEEIGVLLKDFIVEMQACDYCNKHNSPFTTYGIFLLDTADTYVGSISLDNPTASKGWCSELERKLEAEYLAKGYGTEALQVLLLLVFGPELGKELPIVEYCQADESFVCGYMKAAFKGIISNIRKWNIPPMRSLMKLGIMPEATEEHGEDCVSFVWPISEAPKIIKEYTLKYCQSVIDRLTPLYVGKDITNMRGDDSIMQAFLQWEQEFFRDNPFPSIIEISPGVTLTPQFLMLRQQIRTFNIPVVGVNSIVRAPASGDRIIQESFKRWKERVVMP